MKVIDDYVCTFEQSKKLCELGVAESSFYYYISPCKKNNNTATLICRKYDKLIIGVPFYSAFTSQELGELITENIEHVWQQFIFNYIGNKHIDLHAVVIDKEMSKINNRQQLEWLCLKSLSFNEAQARAAFLIYLLENK